MLRALFRPQAAEQAAFQKQCQADLAAIMEEEQDDILGLGDPRFLGYRIRNRRTAVPVSGRHQASDAQD
jgi:hypothetical protein